MYGFLGNLLENSTMSTRITVNSVHTEPVKDIFLFWVYIVNIEMNK